MGGSELGLEVLQLPPHILDGLVELMNLVVQVSIVDRGLLAGPRQFVDTLMAQEPQQPLLACLQPPLLSLRQEPPGQPTSTEQRAGEGTSQDESSPTGRTSPAVLLGHGLCPLVFKKRLEPRQFRPWRPQGVVSNGAVP